MFAFHVYELDADEGTLMSNAVPSGMSPWMVMGCGANAEVVRSGVNAPDAR